MLYVCTYVTDETKALYLTISSLQHGLTVNAIREEVWTGFKDKLSGMLRVIDGFLDDDIICFIDAYDVVANASQEEIERVFLSFNSNLVLSSELICYPEKYKSNFPLATWTNFRYINAGCYIGYKHAIKDFLTWKSWEEIDVICQDGGDQSYLIEYYLSENLHKKIVLDSECKLCLTMTGVDWADLSIYRGKVYNDVLKNSPCFIHFNGESDKMENFEGSMVHGLSFKKSLSEKSRTALKLNEYKKKSMIASAIVSQI